MKDPRKVLDHDFPLLDGGYHLSYPLTKKQKIILSECFDISRENAITRLLDLCKTINAIEKASKSSWNNCNINEC